jgi:hypothetical protein
MAGGEEIGAREGGEAEGERAARLVPLSQSRFSSSCVLRGDGTLSSGMEGVVRLFQTCFSGLFLRNWFLQNSYGITTFQMGP